jgi:hypothetical protein
LHVWLTALLEAHQPCETFVTWGLQQHMCCTPQTSAVLWHAF